MTYNLLAIQINWTSVGIIIGICAVLAIIFATLIVVVSKLCATKEDEKTNKILEQLAGANCGACGYAGCQDFAKAVAEGRAEINDCTATPNENKAIIFEILGKPFVESEPCFAVIKCAGGKNGKDKYDYVGNEGCTAQSTYMGGKKSCSSGCLGGGTCVLVCPHNAIKVIDGVAKVDKSLCGGCGLCAKNCPKNIIEIIPKSAKVYLACSTTCKGKETINNCNSGCISCNLCIKNCPENAITMIDNVPVIDYKKCSGCTLCATKCPRKIIKIV